MGDPTRLTATEMARAVREREVSPLELVEAHIARIEALDERLNAVVVRDFESAREAARRAEREPDPGPLHGVPITVKECIEVEGLPATAASRLFAGHVPEHDAPAVRRLRAAGAIVIGKTNLSELAAHYDSVNVVYGDTHNPHDPDRSAGGSSGGEATAVAARLSPLGVGSDLGSSIRAPAAWCGVVGMRPSYGLVSFDGHAPLVPSWGFQQMATLGPLARTVDDAALGLAAMGDGALGAADSPGAAALMEDDGLQPVSAAGREAARRAAAVLAEQGYEIVDERPPGQAEARAGYDVLLNAELMHAFAPLTAAREEDLSPPLREIARQMRGAEIPLAAYLDGQRALTELRRRADEYLERRPILVCPVAPTTAVPLGGRFDDEVDGVPMQPGGKMTLCTYANALGLPALAVPVMRDPADGMPVGVQLVGRRGHDADVLEAGRLVERELGGYLDPDEAPRSATAQSSDT